MDIQFSKEVAEKAIEGYFQGTEVKGFIKTVYYYMVDSKYRKKIRLDTFLADQLQNPDPELRRAANSCTGKDTDETIINVIKFVLNRVKYKLDIDNWGKNEYWATAIETYEKRFDDCDGINGLIYVVARLAGIPRWLIYSVIGDVVGGGHYWCVYWSPRYDKLVAIDGTYYPTKISVNFRPKFNLKGSYKKMWYVFNDRYIFRPSA